MKRPLLISPLDLKIAIMRAGYTLDEMAYVLEMSQSMFSHRLHGFQGQRFEEHELQVMRDLGVQIPKTRE